MADSSKHTIELNGKRYDTKTGRQLASQSISRQTKPNHTSRSIDGLSTPPRRPNAPQQSAKQPLDKPTQPKTAIKQTARPAHQPAKPLSRHQTQTTKTLMRSSVKRPQAQPKTAIKTQPQTGLAAKPVSQITHKRASYRVDPRKVDHARLVQQSQKIKHFSDFGQRRLPANDHPAVESNTRPSLPLSQQADTSQARQAVQPTHSHSATTSANYLAKTNQQADNDQTIFDQVLANAKSHEQPAPKRTKKQAVRAHKRIIGVGASVLVVVILGAFIAYQNRANIDMQLASAKAGFHATTPSTKPDGYAFKGASASPGMVNISYKAPGGKITIGQKESNWDSQTLEQNYLALSDQKYTKHQDAGKTIFTYGSHQATWVDGGIWYQIQGNADTPDSELVNIATSM